MVKHRRRNVGKMDTTRVQRLLFLHPYCPSQIVFELLDPRKFQCKEYNNHVTPTPLTNYVLVVFCNLLSDKTLKTDKHTHTHT